MTDPIRATPEPDTDAVLRLAAILREVNSPHLLGAAAMAEAILSHPSAHAVLAAALSDGPAVTEEGREPAALAAPTPPADGEAIGPEWRPCVKLPITVYVREQRPGETHVSTREGITPVKADDLIMRGVQGEEYPIGRELFSKTYRLGPAPAFAENTTPPADGEAQGLAQWLEAQELAFHREDDFAYASRCRRAAALLRESRPQPVPVAREPVAWLWEYIGSDPYTRRHSPVARSIHEIDPSDPPYPDTWAPIAPLYEAPGAIPTPTEPTTPTEQPGQ